jgi:hypothetical protein
MRVPNGIRLCRAALSACSGPYLSPCVPAVEDHGGARDGLAGSFRILTGIKTLRGPMAIFSPAAHSSAASTDVRMYECRDNPTTLSSVTRDEARGRREVGNAPQMATRDAVRGSGMSMACRIARVVNSNKFGRD